MEGERVPLLITDIARDGIMTYITDALYWRDDPNVEVKTEICCGEAETVLEVCRDVEGRQRIAREGEEISPFKNCYQSVPSNFVPTSNYEKIKIKNEEMKIEVEQPAESGPGITSSRVLLTLNDNPNVVVDSLSLTSTGSAGVSRQNPLEHKENFGEDCQGGPLSQEASRYKHLPCLIALLNAPIKNHTRVSVPVNGSRAINDDSAVVQEVLGLASTTKSEDSDRREYDIKTGTDFEMNENEACAFGEQLATAILSVCDHIPSPTVLVDTPKVSVSEACHREPTTPNVSRHLTGPNVLVSEASYGGGHPASLDIPLHSTDLVPCSTVLADTPNVSATEACHRGVQTATPDISLRLTDPGQSSTVLADTPNVLATEACHRCVQTATPDISLRLTDPGQSSTVLTDRLNVLASEACRRDGQTVSPKPLTTFLMDTPKKTYKRKREAITRKRNRSYTDGFKLKVSKYAADGSKRHAEHESGTSERKCETVSFRGRSGGMGFKTESGREPSATAVRLQAQTMAQNPGEIDFIDDQSWALNVMRCHRLSVSVTEVCQRDGQPATSTTDSTVGTDTPTVPVSEACYRGGRPVTADISLHLTDLAPSTKILTDTTCVLVSEVCHTDGEQATPDISLRLTDPGPSSTVGTDTPKDCYRSGQPATRDISPHVTDPGPSSTDLADSTQVLLPEVCHRDEQQATTDISQHLTESGPSTVLADTPNVSVFEKCDRRRQPATGPCSTVLADTRKKTYKRRREAATRKGKRNSYPAGFKLKVLKYAAKHGNRKTGRVFGINEASVRNWRKQETILSEMPSTKRACRGGSAKWPALEEDLKAWVLKQRRSGPGPSASVIRLRAQKIANERGEMDFLGGPSWGFKFMHRHGLLVKRKMRPAEYESQTKSFMNLVRKRKMELAINMNCFIGNLDEVAVCFDAPPRITIDSANAFNSTSGNDKTSFTVVLSCLGNGTKVKPMVIFKGKTIPKEKYPSGVYVRANVKGLMNEEEMANWAEHCWRRRPVSNHPRRKSLLVLDSMSAHKSDTVKRKLKKMKTEIALIPDGLGKQLQPLDRSVNQVFKLELRSCWGDWMTGAVREYTVSGQMQTASHAEMCRWVVEAWRAVKAITIINAFKRSGLIEEKETEESQEVTKNSSGRTMEDLNIPKLLDSDTDEEFEGFTDNDLPLEMRPLIHTSTC